eukprot:CAMPEP_0181247828 /NCGR_PEP_ID=MMETSP1096-20121128/44833_1 /TAXON_ID=156174 ORGANISM="Chrysochromulina ericina, Strain CCMP281" /NCGR_SAMPLE_ID=MMETSP1096 /ASSEMBLY_ACC=CAM_ASM_000453 /LENGTH=298 /DNA_ID=CAMNT_0023344933 /DNA_START=279 /DNA_END=1176 /DNA_ORIENTATION=+
MCPDFMCSGGCDASCPYVGQGSLAGSCWGHNDLGVSCVLQNQAYPVMCPDGVCSTNYLFCGGASTPTSAPTPISAPVSTPTFAPTFFDVQKWQSANCGCSTQNAISLVTGSNAVGDCQKCTPPPSVAADTGTCGFLASKNDCYPDNLGYCIAGGQKCCSVNVGALAGIIIGVLAAVIIPIVLCAMFLSCCKCCPCNKHNIKNSEAPRAGLVTGGVPTVSVVQHQLTSPVASKLTGVLSPLSQAEVIKGQNEALVGPTCTTRRHLGVLTVVSYMRTGLMRKGYRSKSSKEPERVRTIRI